MEQVNNYRFLEFTFLVKYCIFRYELAFVVGISVDSWHHSQSDACLRVNGCAMVKALERFWREDDSSLIGFVWTNISSYRSLP